ncbi:hypothetical protein TNCV_2838771 [Trichonephila clavipes]|nr:hypothetical protein TNCV_2838771 [Trichonephila clavipes]
MSSESAQGKKLFLHSRQEIMKAFEQLRQVQRRLYAELANLEIQLHEYRMNSIYHHDRDKFAKSEEKSPNPNCLPPILHLSPSGSGEQLILLYCTK